MTLGEGGAGWPQETAKLGAEALGTEGRKWAKPTPEGFSYWLKGKLKRVGEGDRGWGTGCWASEPGVSGPGPLLWYSVNNLLAQSFGLHVGFKKKKEKRKDPASLLSALALRITVVH